MYAPTLLLLICLFYTDAAKTLPSYIVPCRRSDPNLNQCAKKHAEDALPFIIKGDKAFKSPPLSPLHLESIDIHPNDELNVKLTNIDLTGVENVVIADLQLDLEKKYLSTKQTFPWINIISDYYIDGRVLVLPIMGTGRSNLTFYDLAVSYEFKYKLLTKKDGKQYIDPNIEPKVDYSVGKANYHFDNLFDGDKALGDQTNKFLNENQAKVSKDLGSSVSETVSTLVTSILRRFVTQIPYDQIFLP